MTDDEKNRLFMTLDAQTKQLNRLEQGMFGDDKLQQPGLIKDMLEVKAWILRYRMKAAFVSGAGAVIGFILAKIWEVLTRK